MNKKEIISKVKFRLLEKYTAKNLLPSEEIINDCIENTLTAINYTRCCTELKDKKPLTFKEWKKVNKYTICTDETWFVSPEVGYITTKELKKRYKKHYNL
jgi:hypothetical protein